MKDILNYQPDIKRDPNPVEGDVDVLIDQPIDPTERVNDDIRSEIQSLLNDALSADEKFLQLRIDLSKASSKLDLSIDPSLRPILSQSISKLSDDETNSKINYDLYDKASRILQNAFLVQYGFDPAQLLFARQSGEGAMVEAVNFPATMNCSEIANFDLTSIQSDERLQSIESIMELRSKATQFGLLKILWRMLLSFVLRFIASVIRKTRLHKVPFVGGAVRRFIKKMERTADKIQRWAESGDAFRWDEDNSTLTKDEKDLLSDSGALSPDSSASECVMAASKVVDYVHTWAAATPSNEEFDPSVLLLRPHVDRQQSLHEANKLGLYLSLPKGEFLDDRSKLMANTKRINNYANRYINRTIIRSL